jgi:hypothetical protein
MHFIERVERPGEILECRAADNEIESVAWKRQIGGVAFIESDVDAGFLRIVARAMRTKVRLMSTPTMRQSVSFASSIAR